MSDAVISPGDEDDSVIAEYDVFMTPELTEQIFLLQYPNRSREQPYNERTNSKPVELRIKPESGFIEMDISTTVYVNYDKTKGAMWGGAMKTAKDSGVAAFGIASGFGKGHRSDIYVSDKTAVKRGGKDAQNQFMNFEAANANGSVLNKQTLGGQIIQSEPGMPMYMLGAFRGKELHLTQVTGIAQMRPQFHHLDAQSQILRSNQAQSRAAREPPRTNEPRMVTQTSKVLGANGEEFQFTQTSEFMTKASEEPWTKLKYHDEDTNEAYDIYREKMFVQETASAAHLSSTLNNEQYASAVSAPKLDVSSSKSDSKRRPTASLRNER